MGVAVVSGLVLSLLLRSGSGAPFWVQLLDTLGAALLVAAPLSALVLVVLVWPLHCLYRRLARTRRRDYVQMGVLISGGVLLVLILLPTPNFLAGATLWFGAIPIVLSGPLSMLAFWRVVYRDPRSLGDRNRGGA